MYKMRVFVHITNKKYTPKIVYSAGCFSDDVQL